jgi:hypothetical protein
LPPRPSVLLALAVFVASSACKDDGPEDFPDPDIAPREANPDGVPYPTDNLGASKRTFTRRGDRIPNLAFHAYIEGDRAAGLSTISLSDFYDPQKARHKVLHLQIAATWCTICSSELEATVSIKDQARAIGVVFVEILVSGATAGKGPASEEVDTWMTRHNTNITTAIDVRGRRLAPLGIDPAAMPHDIVIDTRTMEILDSSVGAPLDVGKYVQSAVRFVDTNPPSY